MKVAFINPNPPIEKEHHQCCVCGNWFGWRDESSCYEKMVPGDGYNGYEQYFYLCSDACHEQAIKQKLIDNFFKQKIDEPAKKSTGNNSGCDEQGKGQNSKSNKRRETRPDSK
jgi:hypothetical protein